MTELPPQHPADRDDVPLDERLNRDCFCIDVDPAQVWAAVEEAAAGAAPVELLKQHRAHLFSSAPVFLSQADLVAMEEVVRAIEAIAGRAAYQDAVLAWAPEIAKLDPGPRGAFMGYDFHLTSDGPKLIEVNTNAGGAFLNALLAQAQTACCPQVRALAPVAEPLAVFEDAAARMFEAEWKLQGRAGQPGVVAVIDDAPGEQYLYPEFLLAQAFFERRGMQAVIADPGELSFDGTRLRLGDLAIDLVYNRLVDFAFERPVTRALRDAYLAQAVVVTPNPRNHALLADKRNLTLLSDPEALEGFGVPGDLRRALGAIPQARRVTAQDADALWAGRKSLFFKPASGHAGKAVYRGDKLTRGAWADILAGDFIAQSFAAPSERRVQVDGDPQVRKMDVRLYTYAGETLLAAARLYQGQTTNFRTPGGGFAPVVVVPEASAERLGDIPVCASLVAS
jgi:hypothetical protein